MQKTLLPVIALMIGLAGCGEADPSAASPAAPAAEQIPSGRIASRVADRLPHVHLNRADFDDSIATNALTLFIESLDYDHTVFLASDIAEFQQQAGVLDDMIREGRTDFAQIVFDRFKERLTDRVAYVNRLLNQGLDSDRAETYRWKRDHAPWPADEAEWDEIWRKKVTNEYISRLAAFETANRAPAAGSTNVSETAASSKLLLTPADAVRERYKQYRLLVESNFDRETLLQRYLSAFTRSYDPHSDYLSPRGVEDFDISMSLSLVGVGAMLRSEDGMAKIEQLIPGGPAELDGRLHPGDKIIAVAQGDLEPVSILYWPLSKAVRLIRGQKGTKVVLTVIPADDPTGAQTRTIDLIREEVKLEAQAAKGAVRDAVSPDGTARRIGVITLPEFYADFGAARNGTEGRRASADVRRILNEFATNRIDGVILDLRNNGGGALTEAVEIAGLFIPAGPVVQVREQRGVAVLPDADPETVYRGPLVVLVNRLSASASEIVAAALQDYGRAVVVGDSKTHGKGTVQSVLPLSRLTEDLGSLKVTTASFYRIIGGSTQLKGVEPDIILPSVYDALEIGEEFLPRALPWSQVRSAYYRPWPESVRTAIPELRRLSEGRTAHDPAFAAYLTRRDKLRTRMQNPEVSLRLADRLSEIEAEKELDALQEEEVAESRTGSKPKDDPILDESLRIVSDLAVSQARAGAALLTKARD